MIEIIFDVILVICVLVVTSLVGMVAGRIAARRLKFRLTDIDATTVLNAFFSCLAAAAITIYAITQKSVKPAIITAAVATSLVAPLFLVLVKAIVKLGVRICSAIDRLDSYKP